MAFLEWNFVIPSVQEDYSSVSSCLVAEEMEERGKENYSLLEFFRWFSFLDEKVGSTKANSCCRLDGPGVWFYGVPSDGSSKLKTLFLHLLCD